MASLLRLSFGDPKSGRLPKVDLKNLLKLAKDDIKNSEVKYNELYSYIESIHNEKLEIADCLEKCIYLDYNQFNNLRDDWLVIESPGSRDMKYDFKWCLYN